jgi:hypothetical protein
MENSNCKRSSYRSSTVLKWLFRVGGLGLDSSGSEYGPIAVLVNTGMNLRAPLRDGEFLDDLRDY